MFTLLCVSDSDKHFATAISEYSKRLWKQLQIQELKPFKDDNPQLVIEKETQSLIELLNKKYSDRHTVLLIKEGEQLDTLQIAEKLQGHKTVFIIGGPYGVDERLLCSSIPRIKKRSFGAITLPHGLAKLTLIEQLYRATTLWSGKKYHY